MILQSTTYPGTTEQVIRPILERAGAVVGQDVFLGYAPERVDPGNKDWDVHTTPKLVGGVTRRVPAAHEAALRDDRGDRACRCRQPDGGRDREAAREHLPRGQHRAGQRAVRDVRPARHLRVGGDRRGELQAVRLPRALSRPGPGRRLHPGRAALPRLAAAGVRLQRAADRRRARGQRAHAELRAAEDRRRAQRRRPADQGLADPAARRRVQGRRRGHARVARASRCSSSSSPAAATCATATRTSRRSTSTASRSRASSGPPRRSRRPTASCCSPPTASSSSQPLWDRASVVVDTRNVVPPAPNVHLDLRWRCWSSARATSARRSRSSRSRAAMPVVLADNWRATERGQLAALERRGAVVETADIRDRAALDRLLATGPDRVVLLAAQASRPISEQRARLHGADQPHRRAPGGGGGRGVGRHRRSSTAARCTSTGAG